MQVARLLVGWPLARTDKVSGDPDGFDVEGVGVVKYEAGDLGPVSGSGLVFEFAVDG